MMRSVKTVVGLSVASLLFAGCPKSPQDEISAAESALRAARDAGARDCAPQQFKSAEEMMARTYKLNDEESFDKAKETAVTTKELAEVAKVEAERNTECKPGSGAGRAAEDDETGDGVRLGGRQLSEAEVAQELAETKTGEGALGDGVLVRGLKPVFFAFDESTLSADALAIVTENAEWLKDRPTVKVQVEGHTDERGTAEYNLSLGERRAKTVRDALVRLGVETERIKTISYGEETPVAQGGDESAWSQNRRAEFVVQ
jgi:peptidoglycan-associated lipoprotein